jgi:hypothetical protein
MVIIATPNEEPENTNCNNCELPNSTPAPADIKPLEKAYEQDIIAEVGDTNSPRLQLELGTALTQDREPRVSSLHERPLVTRQRSIKVIQGQQATIIWQFYDDKGVPIDISPLITDQDFKVVLRMKEQLTLGGGKTPVTVDMALVTPEIGKVSGELTKQYTKHPGIYYAEVAIVTDEEEPSVILANPFTLIIERSTFGVQTQNGPPSIAEIRLHLRDSAPAESYLLDNLMFDDAEIALAITRPVMYWNEIPPPIGQFNTQNFPFRYHWLEGICANLFMMVAEQYRRNQLDYSAAGVSVNDQNKEMNYERAGQARWQAYREWVRAKKAEINLEGGYGEVGSLYQYGVYSSGIRSRY